MQPVSARLCRDEEGLLGWESPGIDFGSYDYMQTEHVVLAKGRRFEAPSFAVNDRDLRLVIVHAVERRAWGSGSKLLKRQRGLPLVERLKTAEAKCQERAGRLSSILDNLCQEYVTLRNNRTDDKRLGQLQTLIQGHDTQLIIDRHPAEVYGYILYAYFRTGAASHQIAADLGLHAPCVRQQLSRICKIAKKELHFDLGAKLQQRKTEYEERCRAAKNTAKAERDAERAVLALERSEQRKAKALARLPMLEARKEKLRLQRREQGLCTRCGVKLTDGFKRCATCRAYTKACQDRSKKKTPAR